ncbi:MAG TPA: hypothetical protein VIL78_16315 [Hanamia sp.]
MILLTIFRKGIEVVSFKPADNSSQSKKIMGDNIISLSFELNQIINFLIGDYTDVFGETYYLARAATITKTSLYNYKYEMQMVSSQYALSKAQYMFYDSMNILREGEFSLTGNAGMFIDLMIKNINRIDTGWTKGGIIDTGTKTITFSKTDCGSALAAIATAFQTEYCISGKVIHLSKLENATPYKFKYGNSKGLYEIIRAQVDNTNVVTRLYAFGSEKNLPPDYPSMRLRLPGGYTFLAHNISWTVEVGDTTGDGFPSVTYLNTVVMGFYFPANTAITKVVIETRVKGNTTTTKWETTTGTIRFLVNNTVLNEARALSEDADGNILATSPFFDIDGAANAVPTDPILTSDEALPYLEKNTEIFGVIESNYIDEDIYPHRTGIVSGVDATNIYIFSDSGIDFDINAQLLPGLSAKITFNTGQLAGYTFEISHFNNSTKEVTVLKNKDETAIDVPSALLRPAIGDEYVLTDIEMPISYVQAAEQELQAKAQADLDLYSNPVYQYSIVCDPKYFRARIIKMDIGDVVWLSDSELQIEKYIRVISLTKSLIDEFVYNLELGDIVPVGTFQQLVANQQGTQGAVDSVTDTVGKNALLNGYLICPVAADTSAMKQIFVDDTGKIWKN